MEATTPTYPATPGAQAPAVDPPSRRPGVPMEAEPSRAEGAPPGEPVRQSNADQHLHRAGLDRPTPVVGMAQRPRGVSGALRRGAYRIPEHYARHWMLLMLADRVDVLEDRLGETLSGPLERAGLEDGARIARRNPLAVVAGAVVGLWLTKRMIW